MTEVVGYKLEVKYVDHSNYILKRWYRIHNFVQLKLPVDKHLRVSYIYLDDE